MARVLYIPASPRGDRSHARAVAEAFLETCRKLNPDDVVVTRDVFETDLPPFDGHRLEAKYAILHARTHTAEEARAWKAVESVITEFTSADKYVLAVPMWNFSIPYRLKHYLDLVVQPGYTFSYSPEKGYTGLVTGRRAFVVYARGGEYPAGTDFAAFDMQKPYVELILGFIGVTDVRSVVVEPTLTAGAERADERRDAAMKRAAAMAKDF